MKNTAHLTPRAFTLLETLVAITILTLATAGPLFTANRAIVAAQGARYQLIASYLAQEGIEYVRVMRDDEYLDAYQANPATASSVAWTNFLTGVMPGDPRAITQCRSPNICTLDPTQLMGYGSLYSLNAFSSPAPLYLQAPGDAYTQQSSGATETPFTRTVQAFDVSANEVRIVSKVSWSFHSTDYSVTITDHLTPWQ